MAYSYSARTTPCAGNYQGPNFRVLLVFLAISGLATLIAFGLQAA